MGNRRKLHIGGLFLATYRGVISYIFFLIMLALLYMASLSTSFITGGEKVYFLPDSLWANLLVLAAALGLCLLLHKAGGPLGGFFARLDGDERLFKRLRLSMLVFNWLVISLWVLCTRLPSGGDQITVLDAAYGLARRDFSPLSPVNYLFDYNHQIGLAMVEMLLNRILGEYNFTAYHLINALIIPLVYLELSRLAALFGMKRTGQLGVILLCTLFCPLALYSSFIYGTLPGLALALAAIRLEIVFFRKGGWKRAVLSALCIALAVLFKSNYLIFMVAMLIYAAAELIRSKKAKKVVIVLLILVLYLAQARIPIGVFARMRGADIPSGVSTWAWITMGLQEGMNPGWYNGYTLDTLIGSNFDTQSQEIWVKSDLKSRLEELWQDKDSARDFFVRKTASQWNEPSFECVTILQGKELGSGYQWPKALISESGNYRLSLYLNYLNVTIVAGALLYIVLCRGREGFFDSLVLPMTLIGGFVFHMVWEAKGQYTLPYFMLLLPLAVLGYAEAAGRFSDFCAKAKSHAVPFASKKQLVWKVLLLVLAVLILSYVFHGTTDSLRSDSATYMEYLASRG